jgi:hypothetical protein
MLAAIVTLAAVGQPWVAGVVATSGLAVIVAIFVTGQYQPAPGDVPEVMPPNGRLPELDLAGSPHHPEPHPSSRPPEPAVGSRSM